MDRTHHPTTVHPPPTRATRPAHPRAPRLAASTPVCDGCRRSGAIGPWHAGDDGVQFCAACHDVAASIPLASGR
jgi:hypothetical protein